MGAHELAFVSQQKLQISPCSGIVRPKLQDCRQRLLRACYVFALLQQCVAILLGSDDQLRLWLNGKQIHENLLERSVVPDADAVRANLEAGCITLLARVAIAMGYHDLYLRLSDAPADLTRAYGGAGK